jgi:hypothetical protein
MTQLIIRTEHNHPSITGHSSPGFAQLYDGSQVYFTSLWVEGDEFVADTLLNGLITFPIENTLVIDYD